MRIETIRIVGGVSYTVKTARGCWISGYFRGDGAGFVNDCNGRFGGIAHLCNSLANLLDHLDAIGQRRAAENQQPKEGSNGKIL